MIQGGRTLPAAADAIDESLLGMNAQVRRRLGAVP
jgi:hypothetical protein